MHAEIIAVGTELTSGAKLDTNSQWLSVELAAAGIPTQFHTCVADDLAANVELFRLACERSDIVLITGGLGPTLDDLTREALAAVVSRPLVLHEPSLAVIREMFARRGREMPERNRVQALFPELSEPIANPRGTAPGVWMEVPRAGREACQVAAMPGVPSEMKAMFLDSVLPRLRRPAERAYIRRARVNIFGLGESQCEEMLGDLTARGRDPEVGITVHEATITLRIEAHGHTIEQCEFKIDDARRLARDRLGDAVFGEEDDELQDVVTRLLRTASLTLATAEAGTGGLLGSWLSSVADPSYYSGGIVAAHRRDLQRVLPGVGDASAATDLAAACRQQFGTELGLVAFVDDATTAAELRAWVALASATHVEARDFAFTRDPAIRRAWLSKSALNLLRLHLGGNQGPAGP